MLLYLLLFSSSAVAGALLTCSPNTGYSCPGSEVMCVCTDAVLRLQWTLTPPGSGCMIEYDQSNRPVAVVTSLCEGQSNNTYRVVLDAASDSFYNSTLNITLREDVTVTCRDTFGPQSTSLRIASTFVRDRSRNQEGGRGHGILNFTPLMIRWVWRHSPQKNLWHFCVWR